MMQIFYSSFGGFNSTLGAKDTFTLKLSPDMTGLYVLCTQSGGAPTGELHTGSRFVVEKWTEKHGWQEPDWIPQKYPVAWTDEAWGIPKDKTIVWYIDWDIVYGKLPAGKYRIGKKVTDFRDTGDYDIAMIYAEFEIKE